MRIVARVAGRRVIVAHGKVRAVAADPADGMARDAKFDLEGFKNVLKLRADWTGAAPGTPEKYLDLSYYQKALAGL